MTQYNTLNVGFSNSWLHKLKLGIQNGPQVTFKCFFFQIWLVVLITDFLHKLLLTKTQVSKLSKVFAKEFISKYKIIKSSIA